MGLWTPLQEDMHKRLEKAMARIDSLDDNNAEMKLEAEDVEKDLQYFDDKIKGKNPGVAVGTMLKKMAAEHIYTNEDMYAYASELWLTAEQFEKELRAE